MTSCKQVHQVDTGHLQERRTQGGAPAFAGTLYTRASGACEIQEGYPLPQGLDPVCKLPALADFGDYEIHKPTCCLIRCHWLAGRPSSRATGRVHISKGKILILGVLCKAHCQTKCIVINKHALHLRDGLQCRSMALARSLPCTISHTQHSQSCAATSQGLRASTSRALRCERHLPLCLHDPFSQFA